MKTYAHLMEKAATMYVDEKMSTREIGRALGFTAITATRLLRRAGVKLRTSREGQLAKWPDGRACDRGGETNSKYDHLADQIVDMYVNRNMSTRDIEKILGCDDFAVASILRKKGIALRTSKEGQKVKWPDGRFGDKASNWRGGKRDLAGFRGGDRRKPLSSGYVYIYSPEHPRATKQGYVMEHRLVMEEVLGRYLYDNEIVHHINGKRNDNRPENLEAITRSRHVENHFAMGRRVQELEEENRKLREENEFLKRQISQ